MFVTVNTFYISLIFRGKAGANPSGAPLGNSTLGEGFVPLLHVLDLGELIESDKHSSLLKYGINCDHKSFIVQALAAKSCPETRIYLSSLLYVVKTLKPFFLVADGGTK